jgi:hypothetical protein
LKTHAFTTTRWHQHKAVFFIINGLHNVRLHGAKLVVTEVFFERNMGCFEIHAVSIAC